MFVFGEIDCRHHIYMQYQRHKEQVDIDELVTQTITNYGEVIKSIQSKNFITSVLSVVPAAPDLLDSDLPSSGSPQIRADIHALFNKKLQEFCQENECMYIDVYSKTCDQDGFMLQKYAADKTHLNSKIVPFVIKQLQEEYNLLL
jgi:hypothetical protein